MSESQETPSKEFPPKRLKDVSVFQWIIAASILLVVLIVVFVVSSKSDTCGDWQAKYRAMINDFGEIGSDDWNDFYPAHVDPGEVNQVRREVVILTLVELSDPDQRPVGCTAP
jgi:hypothetical protein